MSIRDPGFRAHENWKGLTDSQRFVAVAWAARNLWQKGEFRSLGKGITSIGHGFRERRTKGSKEPVLVTTQPVLTVFVSQKLTDREAKKTTAKTLIPPFLDLRVPIGDRRILVAIPTDVRREPEIPEAHATKRELSTEGLRGKSCVLARRPDSAALFVVTCRHVVYPSMFLPGFSPRDDRRAEVFATTSNGKVSLGTDKSSRPFGKNRPVNFDAALMRLRGNGRIALRKKAYWGRTPSNWAKSEEEVAKKGLYAHLISRAGELIPLKFSTMKRAQKVRYPGIGVVPIAEVFLAKASSMHRAPNKGDSGAPIIRGQFLLGMYIGGIPRQRLCFAIPAYRLLEGNAFSPRVTLATEVIK